MQLMRRMRSTKCARLGAAALAAGALLLNAGAALAQATPDDPNVIAVQGNAFVPAALTIPAGTTLTWVNMDGEAHDVIAGDLSFESPLVNPGETWQFTFMAPGTFAYVCDLHANMEGVITVVEPTAMAGDAEA